MIHANNDFTNKVRIETRRLYGLNPHVQVMGTGWHKLIAQARVNVCKEIGIRVPVFEEVLQSHETGMDAAIVINN